MRQMPVAPPTIQGMTGANPARAYQGMLGGTSRIPGSLTGPQMPQNFGAAMGQMPGMEQRVSASAPFDYSKMQGGLSGFNQGPVYMADSPRVPAGGGGVASTIAPTWSTPTVQQGVQQGVQQAGLASTASNPTLGRVQGTSTPQYMTNANNAPTAGVAALAQKPIIQQPMASAPAAVAGANPAKKLAAAAPNSGYRPVTSPAPSGFTQLTPQTSNYTAQPLATVYNAADPARALRMMRGY